MPNLLASSGNAGRISFFGGGGEPIHIDLIARISQPRSYKRTSASLERGGSLTKHRAREAEALTLDVVFSDVEGYGKALLVGRWELDHADKSRKRLNAAQQADVGLRVWDGDRYRQTPAGDLWVLDTITPTEEGTDNGYYRATLSFGEFTTFDTQFTTSVPDAAEAVADDVGAGSSGGLQSTVDAGEQGPAIEAGAWP